MTFLFADVTNPTGLIEGLSSEAAKRLLQPAARDMQQAETETLRIHIGLNTGLVLVRSVDTNLLTEYDPVGSTVHMAARMGKMTERVEIYPTGSTAEQVEGVVTMNRLGATRFRGVRRRIATYLLTGLSGELTRWEARRLLGLNFAESPDPRSQ